MSDYPLLPLSILGMVLSSAVALTLSAADASNNPKGDTDANIATANSYDDAWEAQWIAHLKRIRASAGKKTDGFVIHIGDSITHAQPYSQFAVNYKGTSELGKIVAWSKVGGEDTSGATPDSKNGWSLAYSNCPSGKPKWRSFTACKGITADEYLHGAYAPYWFVAGPTDKNPLDTLLNNDSTAPLDGLNGLTVAIVHDAQMAIIMLGTNDILGTKQTPDQIAANLKIITEKVAAKGILPILSTIPPCVRVPKKVQQVNEKIRALAKTSALPLIDYYAEILRRRPGDSWQNTIISGDGVHPTVQGYRDPIKNPAVFNDNGYLLRGFLSVCKIMEVKKYIIDDATPPRAIKKNSNGLRIVVESLPDAKVGQPYSVELKATGGKAPYKWSAFSLPHGLKMARSGTLSGTPAKAGVFKIKLKVLDKQGHATRKTITVTVK